MTDLDGMKSREGWLTLTGHSKVVLVEVGVGLRVRPKSGGAKED